MGDTIQQDGYAEAGGFHRCPGCNPHRPPGKADMHHGEVRRGRVRQVQ